MQIPKVSQCDMAECFYNTKTVCHAPAINVGKDHSECDAYLKGGKHGGAMDMVAMVGACKVNRCRYNSDFLCTASGINVGHHEKHADCKTYSPRA